MLNRIRKPGDCLPTQEAPKSAKKTEDWTKKQELVLEANRKLEFQSASKEVFTFIKGGAPKEPKCEVVKAFAEKHGDKALQEIHKRSFNDFAFNFHDSLDDVAKKEPDRLSYMQALAAGFANFGDEGFRAAAYLAVSQPPMPLPFAKQRNPLSSSIALMATFKMVKDGSINADAAAEHLGDYILSDKVSIASKGALLNMVRAVKPKYLDTLAGSVKDKPTLELISSVKQGIAQPEMKR